MALDESDLISEFMKITQCKSRDDATSCLKTWNFNLKKALIDFNDTSTQNYFKNKTKTSVVDEHRHLSNGSSMDINSSKSTTLSDKTKLYDNYRPLLTKSDSIDLDYKKSLSRGISRANDENVSLVTKARKEFAMDFHTKQEQASLFIDTPDYTFTLPDLSIHEDPEFRKFLEKDLIECSTLNSLENSQRLNWWVEITGDVCRKIWPLSTSGDGNCLLHAASLAMWGFHDRRLTLRKALHNILSEGPFREVLWRRWRFQQTKMNKESGLVFNEVEWAKEWEEIVALASAEPRNNKNSARRRSMVLEKQTSLSLSCPDASIDAAATYDSLEEVHVLALAYVLRRTIIVISDIVLRDINGEALAPVTFGGVYLPLDIPPADCHRVPLLLAYDTAHFSALVTMETPNDFPPALMPLIDFENCLLPIQFCIDPGEDFNWRDYDGREGNWALTEVEHIALLKEYLEVIYASPAGSPDDEIYEDFQSDEEYDKKILDMAITINNEENGLCPAISSSPESENPNKQKSKSAKLFTDKVAKQFGSIGKSMSKKIKKNIGSITKLGKNSSSSTKFPNPATITPSLGGGFVNGKYRLLCAQLRAKRHEYQEEMIKNYIDCAYERFIKQLKNVVKEKLKADLVTAPEDHHHPVRCINPDCDNFGTEKTSYLCNQCYERQKQRESTQQIASNDYEYSYQPPRYGTGNSKFYTQSDAKSHNVIKRLPSVKRLNEIDQTLYLSKSTFFNDTKMHNTIGIPTSPTSTDVVVTKGKTTIIPIRVEGRDEQQQKEDDLIHFESSDGGHSTHSGSSYSSAKSPTENITYRNMNGNNNGLTRCVVNLPVTPPPPSSYASRSPGAFSYTADCVDGSIRNSYDVAKCRTGNCAFFGSSKTNFYCSKCCQEQQGQLQQYRKLQTEI